MCRLTRQRFDGTGATAARTKTPGDNPSARQAQRSGTLVKSFTAKTRRGEDAKRRRREEAKTRRREDATTRRREDAKGTEYRGECRFDPYHATAAAAAR
jgi:hypothetical protein